MYKIRTLNKISKKGLGVLKSDKYEVSDDCQNPDGIILRSFKMHDMELPDSLKAVARAGAGVNNIPIDKCSEKGIVVFNTPGANANAVKELVICGLLLSSRKIVQGINWAKTLKDEGENTAAAVEKGKSNFAGPEIEGKTLGVVGLGAIGVRVANAARHLGMDVIGFDPYLSVDSAWNLTRSAEKADSLDELLPKCDYITIHVPATPSTKGMFDSEAFGKMKRGARLLNFSRDTLVDTADLIDALSDGTISCYVTDFATAELLNNDKVICMPHLGASTPESEENCAVMASREIKDFLENGNIANSVNYPTCDMGPKTGDRVTVAHKNIPNILHKITVIISGKDNINIDHMVNKSRGNYAYTMYDVSERLDPKVKKEIESLDGVIKVRLL